MDETPSKLTTPALLGILLGLGTIAAAAAGLLRRSTHEVPLEEARVALTERFELGAGGLPFALEVTGGQRLPAGELYVTLAPVGGAPEELEPLPFEGKVAPEKKPGEGGGNGKHGMPGMHGPGTEWDKVALREAGTDPVAAAFLFPKGREKGDALLTEQFSRVRFKDIEHLKSEGEALPVDSGHLVWGPYDANWVQLRHFQLVDRVPTFHDTVRVNLTTGPEARVLYLRWARGFPGDVAAAEELLAAYAPLEVATN